MTTRTEHDLLGPVAVPTSALYGAQTVRALDNFPLRLTAEMTPARTLGSFRTLVRGLLLIKKAAARTNGRLGYLPPEKAQAIEAAVDILLASAPADQFPIHALHGGGGTSANMNANEVLANLGEELLGGRRGDYRHLHPNDHVNLHQSTNDVYPTACHLAVITAAPDVNSAFHELADALEAAAPPHVPHLARTCLQDAVDIHFADYFSGPATQIRRLVAAFDVAVDRLRCINLGGAICGRADDVPAPYLAAIAPALAEVTGDPRLRQAGNLFDAAQNPDDLAAVSAALEGLARSLIKIAKDIRLLASGPEAGFGELKLPSVQPGSSAMPGKVNPVMAEFLIQICFRVVGNHSMCAMGLDHGELDLNVWESSMTFAVLESIELLACAVRSFSERCVRGLVVNEERNQQHTQTIIPRLTRLAQRHGYQRVSAVCEETADLEALRARLDQEFGLGS